MKAKKKTKKKTKKKSIGDLVAYSETEKGKLFLGILLVCLGTVLSIFPIFCIYRVIKTLFLSERIREAIVTYSWQALIAVMLASLFIYAGNVLCHQFSYNLIAALKKKIINHIGALPLGFFTGEHKATMRQVLSSDMDEIERYYAHQLPNLVSTLILILLMFILMFRMNALLAMVTLGVILIGLGIQLAMMAKIVKSGGLAEHFKILDRINSATGEYVKGMPEVKIFGNSKRAFKNFSTAVNEYKHFTGKMTAMIRPGFVAFRVFILSVASFIVPAGIALLSRHQMKAEYMVTFVFFLLIGPAVSTPCLKLRNFAEGMNMLSEVVMRAFEMIEAAAMPTGKAIEPLENYDIDFQEVSFAYDESGGDKALDGVSFTAKQGEVTALVGPSGAGKSTIGALIPRFYDPGEGRVKIGGVDIRELPIQRLMDEVSFVFQDNDLLADTVFHNIAMAKKGCTKEEVIEAAKKARCHDFISRLEEGYETVLGKDLHLSGGEKQRIAIARAILKNAPILVLDEATSFAGSENEHLIQEALSELAKNKTLIIIAHRLNTIKGAHQILVVSDGRIVEQGRHDSLMAQGGLYRNMYESFSQSNRWTLDIKRGERL